VLAGADGSSFTLIGAIDAMKRSVTSFGTGFLLVQEGRNDWGIDPSNFGFSRGQHFGSFCSFDGCGCSATHLGTCNDGASSRRTHGTSPLSACSIGHVRLVPALRSKVDRGLTTAVTRASPVVIGLLGVVTDRPCCRSG
jgi:hypothetical protein